VTEASFDLIEFKAADEAGEPAGLFAAIVSVFGNVDRNGDRVVRGAFTESLKRWRESGRKIPVVFSHEHKDVDSFIGEVDPADVQETDKGLVVAGKLDIDSNPKARRIFDLLKSGRLNQWSFAYGVKAEKPGADHARELHEVDLFELGPTLIGANAEALTLAVKEAGDVMSAAAGAAADAAEAAAAAAEATAGVLEVEVKLTPTVQEALAAFDSELDAIVEAKVGRIISARTEAKLRAAMNAITEVLSGLDPEDAAPQASSSPEVKAAQETPPEPPGEAELLRRKIDSARTFLAGR
jgi:HK97 family phage prohead protease